MSGEGDRRDPNYWPVLVAARFAWRAVAFAATAAALGVLMGSFTAGLVTFAALMLVMEPAIGGQGRA